ncbi:GNAT family N-acetyltransferase [Glutamicibacter sp.]|uniref:GNAT family N-acetyltransferase n=1 Tax=Glutamicibacter sp. TaxID=1931995 RepID=UPI0028BE1EA0|nr:GNAT family N-acetyltransferase [Glutamicibacter sp.]
MTNVTITYLQLLSPEEITPSSRPAPDDVRIELVRDITPEYSKFLYRSVGSELNWADRLNSTREQWDEVLRREGSETWVVYRDGAPKGYVELVTEVVDSRSEVEVFYFGLFPEAIGQGLGGLLLTHALNEAWNVNQRSPQLPPVGRVWLHTCSLDGPAALPNYEARGLKVYKHETEQTEVKDASAGLWPIA